MTLIENCSKSTIFSLLIDMKWLYFCHQCLDFAATAHLIHLVFCSIYAGFPKSWTWWLLNLACMALMAVMGEFVCMRAELKAIPVSVSSVKSTV